MPALFSSKYPYHSKNPDMEKKFDPISYFSNEPAGRAYRDTLGGYVTPPPPYDFTRYGTSNTPDKTSSLSPQVAPFSTVQPFHYHRHHHHHSTGGAGRVQPPGAGNSSLRTSGNHSHCEQPSHVPHEWGDEQRKFIIDHHATNSNSPVGDFRLNVLRRNTDSPAQAGSTFSSPRSSISTLASAAELRHLGGSPYSSVVSCSPSPALLDYQTGRQTDRQSPIQTGGRSACLHCLTAAPAVGNGRAVVPPATSVGWFTTNGAGSSSSPADTVIIHERTESGTQAAAVAAAAAARHTVQTRHTGGHVSCLSSSSSCCCQQQQQQQQHTTAPPLFSSLQWGNRDGNSVSGRPVRHVHQTAAFSPVRVGHVQQQPAAYRAFSSASSSSSSSLVNPIGISSSSPGGAAVVTVNKPAQSTTYTTPVKTAAAAVKSPAASVSGGLQFSPAISVLQCRGPPSNSGYHTATVWEKNQMNRSRDISAAVFSQACSEDLDEPPPYKPPASRPKLPTTTTKSLNRSVNVEKKIEQLAEELSCITTNSSIDNETFDDDENYYGQCYACSERVIGEENACQAMGNLYHTSCFICNICGRILRGKAFYHVKGQIMCEEDYLYSGFQSSADKCVACGHLIMDMILQALGKSYHPGCFRCCTCNKTLDGAPFTVDIEGKIFCIEDYQGRYAPTCASCKLPITPVEGSDETVRIVSMEQNFHVDCYACEDCGLPLTDKPKDRRCYPLDGHLLCHVCHMKRREKEQRCSSVRSSIRSRQPLQL